MNLNTGKLEMKAEKYSSLRSKISFGFDPRTDKNADLQAASRTHVLLLLSLTISLFSLKIAALYFSLLKPSHELFSFLASLLLYASLTLSNSFWSLSLKLPRSTLRFSFRCIPSLTASSSILLFSQQLSDFLSPSSPLKSSYIGAGASEVNWARKMILSSSDCPTWHDHALILWSPRDSPRVRVEGTLQPKSSRK